MFEPENDLERSLAKAVSDPSHRPQFYLDLLASEIYFINAGGESIEISDGILKKGTNLQLQSVQRDGKDWLPVFSSLKRLRHNLQTEASHLCLNARNFFEITRGANVILNPDLDYGKELVAAEIESLLDGSIFRPTQARTVEQNTQVMIGQPAVYPTNLVNALSRYFAKHSMVKSAYLAHFFDPASGEAPHTLIGIEASGDWDAVIGGALLVAKESMPENEVVDFIRLSRNEAGVSQYMLRETKPFYRKSFLRSLFG